MLIISKLLADSEPPFIDVSGKKEHSVGIAILNAIEFFKFLDILADAVELWVITRYMLLSVATKMFMNWIFPLVQAAVSVMTKKLISFSV